MCAVSSLRCNATPGQCPRADVGVQSSCDAALWVMTEQHGQGRKTMYETVLRTEDLPAADRFDVWREYLIKTHVPVELVSEHASDFRVTDRVLTLGSVAVRSMHAPPVTVRRTRKLVRQSDPEAYLVSLLCQGSMDVVHQQGRTDCRATHHPYDLVLLSTSLPNEMRVRTDEGKASLTGFSVLVPKVLLSVPTDSVDRLLARRMPGGEGAIALLFAFITQLTRDTASYGPADGPRLGTVVVDLLSAALAQVLEMENSLTPETRRRTLTLTIEAFIQQNLPDPRLAPEVVAAAHHISVSYLHRLFQERGISVAASIRRRRLERVCADLADPAMVTVPVHAIASQWGFTDGAHFSRTFRREYGMTPLEYRNRERPGIA
ncbi:helix-turn-helix domain-containing protein [Streptomyces sp. NBC_01622]|uniref:helix-turn-helix domain-containing protein n=1 Tax=Streptomyces sp. NBC_01622 TaxID=2975903 RepID=UPI00386C96E8|nr:helix-turn-helix domain-containing protein [Streptomyces sp. NBC_01622]